MSQNNKQHWASDPEKLEAYVLHRLDKNERTAFAEHLKDCKDCRMRVQEESELHAAIQRFGRLEMKRRLKQRIKRDQRRRFEWHHVASLAAAVVIMVGAVFAIRWFTETENNAIHSHQIVLKEDRDSHRSIWIIGEIIVQKGELRDALSKRSSSFTVKQGNMRQTVSVRRAELTELPYTMRNEDEHSIRTLLERTPNGLQLTLYTDMLTDSLATGIEAVTPDSLVVFYQGVQIAYHIPGGWAANM